MEAIGIANKINQFFKNENGDRSDIQEVKVMPLSNSNNVLNGEINMFNQDKSVVRLNLNLNIEIYNGKPQRLTLPQGDLILMFIPNGKQATQDQIQGMYKNKVENNRIFFEIPTLLSCEPGNSV